jgi:hypothetical protein
VNNPALLDLLQNTREVGGTFDVYFRGADDDVKPIEVSHPAEPFVEAPPSLDAVVHLSAAIPPQSVPAASSQSSANDAGLPDHGPEELDEYGQPLHQPSAGDPVPASAHELAEARLEALRRASGVEEEPAQTSGENVWQPVLSEEPTEESVAAASERGTDPGTADQTTADIPPSISTSGLPRQTTGLSAIRTELQASADFGEVNEAQIMNEVKRLLGEIARTIDDAAKSVEQRDMFSIYLRAGQLKVADRYPFLDPFGAEFEYLAGEIAFVGSAAPWEFIEGLTEALKIAVEGVAQASTQGQKLRAQVADDLRKLLESNRAEFVEYGLDGPIEQIIGG